MKFIIRLTIPAIMALALVYACSSNRRMTRFEIDYMVAESDRMVVMEDIDSASVLINDLAKKAPDDTLVLFRQGIINRDLGSVEGRIKSERAFRKLVDINPNNARYQIELAKTLIAQTFEMEARGRLARAIELDPQNEEPYLILAALYERPYFLNDYADRAESAMVVLGQLLDANRNSLGGQTLLAEICAVRGQLDSAIFAAHSVLNTDSTSKDANMVMGYCLYSRRDCELAERHFNRGMAAMDSTERVGYESVVFLIPPQNVSLFMSLPADRRDSVKTRVWYELDIDPTTKVNERRIEHYARVWLANLLYTDTLNEVTGWTTDMGETLIRLGMPDDRQRAKIHSGRTSGVPAWYWYYTSVQYPCTLAFVDHMLSGHFRFPFTYSDNTGSSRANASKEIAYLNYRQIPQESYLERERTPIDMVAESYRFASANSIADVQLLIQAPAGQFAENHQLGFRYVVHDPNASEVLSGELAIPTGASESRDLDLDLSQILKLHPGSYQLSIALEDKESNSFGLAISELEIPDFRTDSISMSDIVLGSYDESRGNTSLIERGDSIRIAPSLDRIFSSAKPVHLYYEAYNFPVDIRSLTRFDVIYSFQYIRGSEKGIRSLLGKIFPGKKESVTYSYREGGRSRDISRDIELNVSDLRPGRYSLSVTITDLVRGGSVSRTTELTLIE